MAFRKTESASDIGAAVRGASGFFLGLSLSDDERQKIHATIERQWLSTIERHAPQQVDNFADIGIARYHEQADLLDHGSLWPKSARILPNDAVDEIRTMPFIQTLTEAFGPFTISDEEEVGHEEIYWRLVRPAEANDMGPLHADRWFWDLGHGRTPQGADRVKVWVSIVTEPGRSGLRVVPGSHLRGWRYHGEEQHGFIKPQIDEDEEALGAALVETRPGDAVVFNDKLLHGGAPNGGELTRVSFEFTMFVDGRHGVSAS